MLYHSLVCCLIFASCKFKTANTQIVVESILNETAGGQFVPLPALTSEKKADLAGWDNSSLDTLHKMYNDTVDSKAIK